MWSGSSVIGVSSVMTTSGWTSLLQTHSVEPNRTRLTLSSGAA
jgi:hypothetical protein